VVAEGVTEPSWLEQEVDASTKDSRLFLIRPAALLRDDTGVSIPLGGRTAVRLGVSLSQVVTRLEVPSRTWLAISSGLVFE
jgi:hypothetical protein